MPTNARTPNIALGVLVVAAVLTLTSCAPSNHARSTAGVSSAPTADPITGSPTSGPVTTPGLLTELPSPAHPPSSAAAYVGIRWELSSVQRGGQQLSVPASYAANIEFAPAGTILMSDSVNALFGHYTTTPTGFITSAMGTTMVGYAGTDPTRTLVIAAVDAIAYGPMTNGTSAQSAAVDARVIANQLIITVAGYKLTLDRAGSATDPTQPAPTSSAVS